LLKLLIKMYWSSEQEDLVCQWLSANTLQQFIIYKALNKSVKYMAGSILSRYFIPTQEHENVKQDAINHLFVNLHHFNPAKGKTAYSYCQTIIKNFYHEVCRNKAKIFTIKLEYYDDLENPEFEYSYSYEPFQEDNWSFEPVFKRLEQARFTLMSYSSQHKKMPKRVRNAVNNEIKYLNETTEYLFKYKDSQGVSAASIQEYVLNRMGLSEGTVQKYMKKHLGVGTWLCNDLESKVEKKYSLNPIDDDYCPIETSNDRQLRRKMILKLHE
jgi:DNA-directed RNA polymerase specialized sigma24 family protein